MRKLLILVIFPFFLNAQVGINTTTPHASASLDVYSTNSGLLIPRISLTSTTDATTISNPATGLLIYNISTTADVTHGFYYWDVIWRRLANDKDNWKLDGNNLTTGNEYLGTNNSYPLVFKTNNTSIGKFHPNGGINLGFNAVANENSSIAIGQNATASQVNAIALGYNTQANGFRSSALGFGATVFQNDGLALGFNAKSQGYRATAIGCEAVATNNDGVALGYKAMTTGIYGIAMGYEAITEGQSAVAVGYQSKAKGYLSSAIGNHTSATGSWSTAIGYGATTAQDNAIVLGNVNNSKVGIGTSTPEERLHVVGNIKIDNGSQGAGKVMVSDANGIATWVDLDASKAYGEIFRQTNTPLVTGAIAFDTVGENNNVAVGSNSMQIQTTGLYKVSYTITLNKVTGGAINPYFYVGIWGAEVVGTRTYATIISSQTQSLTITKFVHLNAYQVVSLYASLGDSNTNLVANGCNFMIELIKRT